LLETVGLYKDMADWMDECGLNPFSLNKDNFNPENIKEL